MGTKTHLRAAIGRVLERLPVGPTPGCVELRLSGWICDLGAVDDRELGQPVLIDRAVAEQVANPPAADEQRVGDHAPMAAPPVRLGAHHRQSSLAGRALQGGEAELELLGAHVVRVALKLRHSPAAVAGVARGLRRPPSSAPSGR